MRELLRAGDVSRYHTIGVNMQTVGHHSWGVAMLISKLHPNPSVNLLKAALWHDMAERVTGDLPAPVKWNNPQIAKALEELEAQYMVQNGLTCPLTLEEVQWLKFCDMLECYFYAEQAGPSFKEVYLNAKKALEQRVAEYQNISITQAWRSF